MSSDAGRTSAAAPGSSSSPTRCASPRTIATGMPLVLPLTRSAAEAISSAAAAIVTSMRRPLASGVPRRSSSTRMPAAPIATSVCPCRHGRPSVSVMMTPIRTPNRSRSAAHSARAEASGSSGSSSTTPSGALLESTPAAASTMPSLFSTMRVTPPGCARVATTRTVSSVIAASRSFATTCRPSALLTIFDVTRQDVAVLHPAGQPRSTSPMIAARSSPATISPIPSTPQHLAASCHQRTSFGSTSRPNTSSHSRWLRPALCR